jgi:hypothetical protein
VTHISVDTHYIQFYSYSVDGLCTQKAEASLRDGMIRVLAANMCSLIFADFFGTGSDRL